MTLKEIFDKHTEKIGEFDRKMGYDEFENAVAEINEVVGSIPKSEGEVHIAMAILYWYAFKIENKKEFYEELIKSLNEEITSLTKKKGVK
jgi:hypothetical protein